MVKRPSAARWRAASDGGGARRRDGLRRVASPATGRRDVVDVPVVFKAGSAQSRFARSDRVGTARYRDAGSQPIALPGPPDDLEIFKGRNWK